MCAVVESKIDENGLTELKRDLRLTYGMNVLIL